MGEIDDFYKDGVELIDQEFLESFKKGEEDKKIVEDYRKKLADHQKRFEENYVKHLAREKKRLSKIKKKKRKKEKFKRLEVEHFNFEFNKRERFAMRWRIFWFGVSRRYHKIIEKIFPRWFLYRHYKTMIFLKGFFWDLNLFRELTFSAIKRGLIYDFTILGEKLRDLFRLIIKISKAALAATPVIGKFFKGSAKKDGEGKEGESGKGDGAEKGENSGEKEKGEETEEKKDGEE